MGASIGSSGQTGRGWATSNSLLARAALLSIKPVIPSYTVATVLLNFVGNRRCSRALEQIEW